MLSGAEHPTSAARRRRTRGGEGVSEVNGSWCDLQQCGRPSVDVVEHPQRGELEVCEPHFSAIQELREENGE